jgi:hypothetical protein
MAENHECCQRTSHFQSKCLYLSCQSFVLKIQQGTILLGVAILQIQIQTWYLTLLSPMLIFKAKDTDLQLTCSRQLEKNYLSAMCNQVENL